jgi:hypothetical protein
MNVATDGHPGIGREGSAPRWIVVQDGSPETNAPGLQGLFIGQPATPLTPYDGVNQPLVMIKSLFDAGWPTYWSLSQPSVAELWRRRMGGILNHEIPPFAK